MQCLLSSTVIVKPLLTYRTIASAVLAHHFRVISLVKGMLSSVKTWIQDIQSSLGAVGDSRPMRISFQGPQILCAVWIIMSVQQNLQQGCLVADERMHYILYIMCLILLRHMPRS